MKLTLLSSLLFLFSLSAQSQNMTEISVTGMHCSSCERALVKKICEGHQLANCEAKITDIETKSGVVRFSTPANLNLSKIKADIEAAGYKVK